MKKGEKMSLEQRAKISASNIGKKFTEAHKNKLKESRIKFFQNGGTVWHKGKSGLYHPTEKTKLKMSLAHKGKINSESHCRNISLSKSGKMMGSLASNWKGGKSPLNKRLRTCPRYRKWKIEVFKRDNKKCQLCGITEKEMDAHHKNELQKMLDEFGIMTFEKAINDDRLWIAENGLTLCRKCHLKVHYEL